MTFFSGIEQNATELNIGISIFINPYLIILFEHFLPKFAFYLEYLCEK